MVKLLVQLCYFDSQTDEIRIRRNSLLLHLQSRRPQLGSLFKRSLLYSKQKAKRAKWAQKEGKASLS